MCVPSNQQQRSQTSLDDTVIRAPFSGTVLEKHLERGSWVQAGGNLITLQSDQKLEAWLDVPEGLSPASVTLGNLRLFQGETTIKADNIRIISQVHEQSRNYKMILEINNKHKNLLPGMSIQASLPSGQIKPQLLIPADALGRNGAGYFVFKAQPGPKGTIALPVPVQVLFRAGQLVAIQTPMLQPGEQVVTEGNERLFPMMPIQLPTREK